MDQSHISFTVSTDLLGGGPDDAQQEYRRLLAELRQQEVASLEIVPQGEVPAGAKAVDPALIGALAVAAAPVILPKLLDFLHAWAMCREGRVVKVKIQAADGRTIEGEFPATMTHEEARQWIAEVAKSLPPQAKPKAK